jgi:hypothetical protein
VDAGSSDNCAISSLSVSPDTFGCSEAGTTVAVTLTVTDTSGNSASCVAMVTVEDDLDPVAVCTDITVDLDAAGTATITAGDIDFGSTDNCSIDSLSVAPDTFGCSDIGAPVTVTLTVLDPSGNSDTCTALVTVEDNLAPVITCPADQTHIIAVGDLYTVPDYFSIGEASAADNCTTPVTITSQDPMAGSMIDIGVYTVTITAEDAYGNESMCTFELTIENPLGTEDYSLENLILLYPNPAQDKLYVQNNSNEDLKEMLLFDISGKLISKFDLNQFQKEQFVNISRYDSGIYIIKLTTGRSSIVKQLIIR